MKAPKATKFSFPKAPTSGNVKRSLAYASSFAHHPPSMGPADSRCGWSGREVARGRITQGVADGSRWPEIRRSRRFRGRPERRPARRRAALLLRDRVHRRRDTYADVGLTTPNPNPVIADANGRFGNIWLSPANAYKVQLWTAPTVDDPTGTQIWSFDPVGPASGGAPSNNAGIIGEVRAFAGPAANIPSQWYLCYGQAISRTTYASLFAVIGTTWGVGDGTTTFNVPDLRGRTLAGKDDMGGSAANRITSGTSGISGVTLGAAGGDQRAWQHTHTVNDPGRSPHHHGPGTHAHLLYLCGRGRHHSALGRQQNSPTISTRRPYPITPDGPTGHHDQYGHDEIPMPTPARRRRARTCHRRRS